MLTLLPGMRGSSHFSSISPHTDIDHLLPLSLSRTNCFPEHWGNLSHCFLEKTPSVQNARCYFLTLQGTLTHLENKIWNSLPCSHLLIKVEQVQPPPLRHV